MTSTVRARRAVPLAQEIAALHRIGERRDFSGNRICLCFGWDYDLLATDKTEWLFEISQESGLLNVRIDAYTAKGVDEEIGFDVDEWEGQMIIIEAAATRENFVNLSRAARAVLNGKAVEFSTGLRIDGIRRAAQ